MLNEPQRFEGSKRCGCNPERYPSEVNLPLSSRGLGHRPLTAETRVRIPVAVLAASSLIAAAITWLVAVKVPLFSNIDVRGLQGFLHLHGTLLGEVLSPLSGILTPVTFGLFTLAIVCIALARRRVDLAIAVGFLLAAANITPKILKPLLAVPRHVELHPLISVNDGSWPSGHSTAVMSLVLALVLVLPLRLRPLAVMAGSQCAVLVGFSLLIDGWHYPSDVIGGFLIAAFWSCLAVGLIARRSTITAAETPTNQPRLSRVETLSPPLAGIFIAGIGVAALGLARFAPASFDDAGKIPLLIAALAIGAVGFGTPIVFNALAATDSPQAATAPHPHH